MQVETCARLIKAMQVLMGYVPTDEHAKLIKLLEAEITAQQEFAGPDGSDENGDFPELLEDLRDQFAAAALTGLISQGDVDCASPANHARFARWSFAFAEALLEARKQS